MQLKISEKNSKIGKIPNLSFPPGKSCILHAPCFNEGCYAVNPFERWPNVRKAWEQNLNLYLSDAAEFGKQFNEWLYRNKPERFRMFVGGDFPDIMAFLLLTGVMKNHPATNFLAFTKRYKYPGIIDNDLPDNLTLVLSTWPGHPLPTNKELPWSWLEEDPRIPSGVKKFVCKEKCFECGHTCWDKLDKDTHIIFKKH